MKIIMHDLNDNDFFNDEYALILNGNSCNKCIGCFKCWTDGNVCVQNDKYNDIGISLLECDELLIVSKCNNGCYSSKVKKMLERSISYLEPFFCIRNGEIHHKPKISKKIHMKIYFYGHNLSESDKNVAKKLVDRNKINFNSNTADVYFFNDYKEIII